VRLLLATGHAYLPDRVGGTESSIHELCSALAERGLRVAVLARRAGARPPLQEDRGFGYPVLRSSESVEGVSEAVRRFRPQAAVVQSHRALLLARSFRAAGVPVLVYLRDVQLARLGGVVAPESGVAYLANSRFTASRIREVFGVAPRVVPPLVLPERYRTAGEGTRVLFVNPVPVKGWEVACSLVRARPDLDFDFVEGWPVSARVRARWRDELGDAPNVRWHAPARDMRPLYARARVLLVPSLATPGVWEEGWGRVVTEAHCSGIPVLASRSGGLPEAVGPGGFLVDADAPGPVWQAALARIVDDPHEHAELSRAARSWAAREEIQPERLIDAFLDALAGLIGAPAHAAPQTRQEASSMPSRC
jgi:glycosyltransferase involved in cell wall biosynthesis